MTGVLRCSECEQNFHSTMFLRPGDHACPECGSRLGDAGGSEDRAEERRQEEPVEDRG